MTPCAVCNSPARAPVCGQVAKTSKVPGAFASVDMRVKVLLSVKAYTQLLINTPLNVPYFEGTLRRLLSGFSGFSIRFLHGVLFVFVSEDNIAHFHF